MPESRIFSKERLIRSVRDRINPIRGLTPALLVTWIEQWRTGYLRPLAMLWEELEDRDTTLKGVVAKRVRSAARCPWEIVVEEDSDAAESHRQFLEDFYARLTVTSVLERDTRGGVSLLLRQMMRAVGHRYSVHEIVWRPGRDGSLTAELHHAPLWFFESRTGKLQYLESDFLLDGQPMRPGEWLVTVGDGLMMASAIAYLGKDLAYKDWLAFSEKFGLPFIDATTSSAPGKPEWDELVDAVSNFYRDGYIVRNTGATISLLEAKGASGQMPQPALVDYVNREFAALWRGGDLSTLSAQTGQGQGASLQGDEARDLLDDDCGLLTEALNLQLDTPAIEWKFGRGTKPLAYIRISPPSRRGVADEVVVDRFLAEHGFPLGRADVAERYGRSVPGDDEPTLTPPQAAFSPFQPGAQSQRTPPATPAQDPREREERDAIEDAEDRMERAPRDPAIIANVAEAQRQAIAAAFARDLQPVSDRLKAILRIEDLEIFAAKLRALIDETPRLLRDIGADPDAARELEALLAKSLLDGLTQRTRGGV